MLHRVITALPLIVVLSQPAPRQHDDPPSWGRESTRVDHTLTQTHQIGFPGSEYINAVQFSLDGQTAYCLVDGQSVDLWAAGVNRWPEVLGGALGVVLLIYLLVVARVRRHPQARGQPHCRRCNYNVVSQAPDSVAPKQTRVVPPVGTLCPECGTDLSKRHPRRGRSLGRRLAAPTALLLILVIGYVWLHIAGYSRGGKLAKSVGIWSTLVDDYTEKHQPPWLLAHRIRVFRIMTVDTESGRITGQLRTQRGVPSGGMKLSPDGRFLALAEGNQLQWISVRSGRVVASTSGGSFRATVGDEFIAGFGGSSDDPWVYYGATDQAAALSRLLKWRPRTGEQKVVIEEPAFVAKAGGRGNSALTRRYAILHRADGIATVSAPDFMQSYDESSYVITVRAPAEQGAVVERTIPVVEPHVEMSPILASPDGETLYLCSMRSGVIGVSLRTGEYKKVAAPSMFESSNGEFTLAANGQRVYIPVHAQSILVKDLVTQRWLGRLSFPTPFIAPHVFESPDGRWLAATPFKSTGTARGPYTHELFLFDLTKLKETGK